MRSPVQILLHLFPDATGLGSSMGQRGKGHNSQSRENTPMEDSTPQGTPERFEEVCVCVCVLACGERLQCIQRGKKRLVFGSSCFYAFPFF